MNQVRTFLLFAWLLVGFLLWDAWQRDYAQPPMASAELSADAAATPSVPTDASLPSATAGVELPAAEPAAGEAASAVEAAQVQPPLVITTDVLRLRIDPRGASVVGAELLDYRQSTTAGAPPVTLLDDASARFHVAQYGWVSTAAETPSHQALFSSSARDYQLNAGDDQLEVQLSWQQGELTLQRSLRFQRGSYVIEIEDRLRNAGSTPWRGTPYYQLQRRPPPTANTLTNPEAYSFVGAAWYSAKDRFNKIAFDDFDPREPLDVKANSAWVAMLQHYFFAAWIPPANESLALSTSSVGDRHLIRAVAPALELAPGSEQLRSARLYVGPKLQDQLAAIAPGLELTIDYGILTFISEPLHWLLSLFHDLSGNWGLAIILLVLLIKALFFKLSEAQYRSFAKMRQVQPRIEALKERYGDDRQKFNLAMMELYKKEKINPVGGCLPILLQLPVFFALYWVLLESVELRHAPFFGWIQNLTAPDPYFVLPVLNLAVMWLTQKLQPAPGMDPLQRKMLQWMPVVFGVLFAFFPSGLVLYWTVNGALGLLQQWVITRRFEAHKVTG